MSSDNLNVLKSGDSTMEETVEFLQLVEQQQRDKDTMRKLFSNTKALPLARRTEEKLNKISNVRESLWAGFVTRDSLLKDFPEYEGSTYNCEQWFQDVESDNIGLGKWLGEKRGQLVVPTEVASRPKVAMRKFYWDMITERMANWTDEDNEMMGVQFQSELIEKYLASFLQWNFEVIQIIADKDKQKEMETESLARVEEVQNYLKKLLATPQPGNPPVTTPHSKTSAPLTLEEVVAALSGERGERSDFRLPRIELPKFSGDLAMWRDYEEKFSSMIDKRAKLSDVEKMHYLKESLSGPALATIKDFSITQYKEGWEAIKLRYNNPKVRTFEYLKLLMALPTAGEKSVELRKLLDSVKSIRMNLSDVGIKVREWNSLFVFLVSQRLPKDTFEAWEQGNSAEREVAPFEELEKFLENRLHTLKQIESRNPVVKANAVAIRSDPPQSKTKMSFNSGMQHNNNSNPRVSKCTFCQGAHLNYRCLKFNSFSAADRKDLVEKHRLCVICLNDHGASDCPHKFKCKLCNGKHNTVIHVDGIKSHSCTTGGSVVLATAELDLLAESGEKKRVRVLIDQGSQVSLVSEAVVQHLRLNRRSNSTVVEVIGGGQVKQNGSTILNFVSKYEEDKVFEAPAYILPKILTVLPEIYWPLPEDLRHLDLADSKYWRGGAVDVVLGADIFPELLLPEMIKSTLLAQRTHLGWILSGRVGRDAGVVKSCAVKVDNLEKMIKKFFESEEKIVEVPPWTEEHTAAENYYVATTQRDCSGRYVVRLPLKSNFQLGASRGSAVGQMRHLEKRFQSNPELKLRYVSAMEDYFKTGHAVYCSDNLPTPHCYLPHLAVIKEDSATTKTRVVFNASSPTSNKKSLNDNLLVGPVVQRDLVNKIIRFRLAPFVFICDIEKMYRQIIMNKEDQDLQRFIWRASEDEPLRDCRLTTVTFGEASAPFTATRTLVKLAEDLQSSHPKASSIIRHDSYVDDIHNGEFSEEELMGSCNQLIEALQSAGFSLRKFSTNSCALREKLDMNVRNDNEQVKFVGLVWEQSKDTLTYPTTSFMRSLKMSKRQLLSEISKLFDPMGFLQPIIAPAKFLMQEVTREIKDWNGDVPQMMIERWNQIISSWELGANIQIPRCVHWKVTEPLSLHGFGDASEKGYGAVVYLVGPHGVFQVLAKGKVAPEVRVTIPRLELKAAIIVCELLSKVKEAISDQINNLRTFAWSDSKVVISWIKGDQTKWKPFIRNRTAIARETVTPADWNYVKSEDNPADQVSRGVNYFDWNMEQWFKGPQWLADWEPNDTSVEEELNITGDDQCTIDSETLKPKVIVAAALIADNVMDGLIENNSSFDKLCRIVAWMIRFGQRTRKTSSIATNWITLSEKQEAVRRIVRHVQSVNFPEELKRLANQQPVGKSSKLRSLVPFLDEAGVMRVLGRLSKSPYNYDMKHPMIISNRSLITAIVLDNHKRALHGGVNLTLGEVRKRFWMLNGLQVVKKIVHGCVTCRKAHPQLMEQMMASLPPDRVTFSKPFWHSGVDFAGPFTLKGEVGRGSRRYKAYVAVFICLATKAVHFEVVSSLSTEAFLNALRRFVGRRGPVARMYSDNGTNLVGAFRQLEDIQAQIHERSMEWTFIPPLAPHFGGLWEAGVKSMKTHLKKILKDSLLTIEEMSTVLVQVEAVLNSRPLCPMTNSPEDLDVLTPAHFLVGQQYVPVPENPDDGTLRQQFGDIQRYYNDITRRYKTEYVTRLNQRPKWLKLEPKVLVGELVLLAEDNIATTKWSLGRVLETYEGTDGLIRVVKVKTKDGEKTRPITKIARLPCTSTLPTAN